MTRACPLQDPTFDLKIGKGIGPHCASIKVYSASLTANSQIEPQAISIRLIAFSDSLSADRYVSKFSLRRDVGPATPIA